MRIFISVVMYLLIVTSCTPDMDDDYVRIDFINGTEYQLYSSDTSAVLVKAAYYAYPSRNGVSLGDTVYSANALFFRTGASEEWIHHYTFGNDSNLTAVKRDGSDLYFRYADSLLYRLDLEFPAGSNSDSVHISIFDTLLYQDTLGYVNTDSSDIDFIDGLNNSSKWYKPYRQWHDEIINLYR